MTRPRLLKQLSEGSQGSLTLICAPAGSGKSVLLSEWLVETGTPYGWISLDERDNERDLFLQYVLAAVHQAFPEMGQETRMLLDARIPPPLETIVRSLSNDFDHLEQDFVLVLDDYHVITNSAIHELLQQLLQHPPARLHLVVTTRSDLPWSLAALWARGQVTELHFPDLRFTAAESTVLLKQALGPDVPHDVLATLRDECEGWAAGLQLMTLVLRGQNLDQPYVSRRPSVDEDIGAYLLDEVLSRQEPRDQDRLLQLSILGRFSATLCEAVCAEGDSSEAWGKAFLARLDHANLFVIALDAKHEFYRFHHLFQQFLAARLRERFSPEEIRQHHRRASAWFAAHGLIEEALDHALEAGDTVAAGQLVAGHRYALYNQEQFARLTRWLRLLPTNLRDQTPELLLAEARVATMNWRFTEAAVLLDRAEDALSKRDPGYGDHDALHGELEILRGMLHLWDGDAQRLMASSRYALDVLPPNASHLRGMAHIGMASAQCLLGEGQAAWAYLDEQLARQSSREPIYTWLLETQGFLHWLEGDLTQLHDVAWRLLRVSEDLELSEHEAMGHYFLGIVFYARNELEAAEQHLRQAVTARYTMRLLWWCQAAGLLGLTAVARGQPAAAQEILEDAYAFLLAQHAVRILPNMGAFQAEAHRLEHRLVEAYTWAAGVELPPPSWSLVVEPHLIQARVFLSQMRASDQEHAAQLLAKVRAICERVPNYRLLMEVDVLEAILIAHRGDTTRALQTLERVVRTAEAVGWVRLFVDLGPPMASLLTQLAAQGVTPSYIEHVLAAFPEASASTAMSRHEAQSLLIEPLSEREVEVLTLLTQRFSNKEIAVRLFISPATVKYHTINIYRKLEVSDRQHAVARAVTLGLVSTET